MSATGSTEEEFSVRLVAPSDGEEESNETLIKEDLSREVIVRVDLFTVVVTFAVLLTLISVGTVANVAVLVVLKYRKRVRAAVRRDAALCNMSVVQLLICLVLAPIEFATVAESYVKHSLPAYVCLARDCGFHLLIAALVTAVVLAALCQARRLGADRTPSRWREALPVLQFTVPWIVGACAAAISVSTRLLTSLGFEVCRKSIAFWERVGGGGEGADPWQLDLVLGPVYFLALCGALLWLVVVVARRRWRRSFEETEKQEGECLPSPKESRKMKLIKDGGDGDQPDNRTSSLEDPNPSSSKNPDGKRNSRITASGNQKPPDSQENEEVEETDDVFDLKMRTEFENKSRSSGRRHTVANIGLPDLEDLRSGSSPFGGRVDGGGGGSSRHRSQTRHPSSSSPSSSSSSKKTPEYHYVRKWSVDITALANQLENPKAHSDTSPFKEKVDEDNGYEEAIKGLQAPSNACIVASCEYIGPPGAGTTEKSPGAGDGAREAPEKVRPSSSNGGKETGRSGIEEKCIVTKGVSPRRQDMELSLDSGTKEPSVGGAEERGLATAAVGPGPLRDARDTAKMARELTTLTKMLVLVSVSLLLACPCFVLFVWFSVSPVQDLHLGYNLSVASEMIVMLQAAVHPVLLLWVDQRLRRRARRLLAEASHLRCVCYCNVGRQGNCLRPPQKASVASRQRTADEKAPLKA